MRRRVTPSRALRERVLRRDHHRCRGCGADDPLTLVIDHILPVAKGGRTTFANLQTLCESCNTAKAAQYPWVSPLQRATLRTMVGLAP